MNGIIVINKSIGYTSRDIVNKISKHFNTKKVGHCGTLDPGASGVLVICLGKALKVCELLTGHDKEYIAGVTLGIETDTLDMDGNILKNEDINIDDKDIIDAVNSFAGKYSQEVPKYSAVKVNGKKLYEYARANIDVDLPKRDVQIYDISIIDNIVHENGKINFKIKCNVSKGTYIRSLVRDIGNKLGVPAVMSSLVRTKQGNFSIDDSYSLDDIDNDDYKIVDITDVLTGIPVINVDDEIAFKVRNGVILDKFFDSNMAFIKDKDNNLLALYRLDNDKCRAYKMFL